MNTRIKQFLLVAVLGVILSVALSGTAQAEEGTPDPDIYLVSPTTVELPTTVMFASHAPEMSAGCGRGEQGFVGNVESKPCDMYFVRRTDPDANGLYYFTFRFVMYPPGQVTVGGITRPSPPGVDPKHFSFTVTDNRLRYGGFRTCIDFQTGKALIAWYALRTTEVALQLERKVRRKQKPRKWVWKRREPHRQKSDSVWYTSETSYVERSARFRVPDDLVRHVRNNNERKRLVRAKYVVKLGKKILKRGWVSRRLCREFPFPPYVLP